MTQGEIMNKNAKNLESPQKTTRRGYYLLARILASGQKFLTCVLYGYTHQMQAFWQCPVLKNSSVNFSVSLIAQAIIGVRS